MTYSAEQPGGQYFAPAMAYPPAQPTRTYSLGGLVTALTVLLALIIVAETVAAAGLFYRASLFDTAARGGYYTDGEATLADVTVLTSAIAYFLLFVAIAVVFIVWQWRHAKNAQALGVRSGLGPGWAIGGWFIPVAGLFLPAMQIHHSARGTASVAKSRSTTLIVFWALTFALGNVLMVPAMAVMSDGTSWSAEALRADALSDRLEGVSSLAHMAAGALCIAMVRLLSARQRDALGSAPQADYPQYGYPAPAHPPAGHSSPGYPPAPQPQPGHSPASQPPSNPWEAPASQSPPGQGRPPGPPQDPWQTPPR